MSEKKVVETEGTETTQAEKKPVAKAKAAAKEPEKKESIFTRAKNAVKRNKKAIIAGVSGLGVGVAGTVAYGMYANKRAERKAREQVYVPQEETNPLDPNL